MLVNGCKGGGESPSDVAKAFYMAGNKGNYSKAESYLSFEAKMIFKTMPELAFDTAMDAATKEGSITRIDIEGGKEYDEVAIICLTLHYKDGTQNKDGLTLMKENGKWKISESSLLIVGAGGLRR